MYAPDISIRRHKKASLHISADDRINFDYFVKMILGFIRRADPEAEMKEGRVEFSVTGFAVCRLLSPYSSK